MQPFGPFKLSGNRYVTGPDRFSETIGEKPTHTVAIAEMRYPSQTVAFRDKEDMIACGRLLAAAPDLLAACRAVLDEFPALDSKRIESVKAICRAAIAKAEGA